jgi:hypothetical protein
MRRVFSALVFAGALAAAAPAPAQQTPPSRPPLGSTEAVPHDHGPDARMTVRTVAMLQEEFKHHNNRYATSLAELRYTVPEGVAVTFANPNRTSFSLVARYNGNECTYFRGNAPPPRNFARESTVVCQPIRGGSGNR